MYELFVDGSRRFINNTAVASAGYCLKKNGNITEFIKSKLLGSELPQIGMMFETYAVLEGISEFIKMKNGSTGKVHLKIYTDCHETFALLNNLIKKSKSIYSALLSIFNSLKGQFKSITVIHKKRCSNKELRLVDHQAYILCLIYEKQLKNCGGKMKKNKRLLELEERLLAWVKKLLSYFDNFFQGGLVLDF